jgi:hypothetical protein
MSVHSKRTSAEPVGRDRNMTDGVQKSFRLDGFKIRDAIVVRVVGVLLFFAGLVGLVLFEKFVGYAKGADCHADHLSLRESHRLYELSPQVEGLRLTPSARSCDVTL